MKAVDSGCSPALPSRGDSRSNSKDDSRQDFDFAAAVVAATAFAFVSVVASAFSAAY